MNDNRSSFDEEVTFFRDFLYSQQWSPNILWLTRERITGHRRSIWIYRPEELTSDKATRDFYNSILETDGSIRIDGLIQVGSNTLGYVENYGGDSKMMNHGCHTSDFNVHIVQSPIYWRVVQLVNKLRGISPFLRDIKITGRTSQLRLS